MKKLVSLLLALVLVFAMGVPSFATSVNVTNWPSYFTGFYDSDIYSVLSDLVDISEDIENYVFSLDTNVTLIRADILEIYALLLEHFNAQLEQMQIELVHWQSVEGSLSSINGWLVSLNQFLSTELSPLLIEQHDETLTAIGGVTSAVNVDANWNKLNYYNTSDLLSYFYEQFYTLQEGYAGYSLYMLQQVLADEDDLALKESQKDNQNAVFDNFFSGGNSTSVKLEDIGYLSSLGSDFFSLFNFSDIFGNPLPGDVLNENGEWLYWFSEATYNDLNQTAQTFNYRNSNQIFTHFYEDRQAEFESFLDGGDK